MITVDANHIRLGSTFAGGAVDATSLGTSVSGVDPSRSMIRFSGFHHFETGDAVVYRVGSGGSSIGTGFGDGTVLYVRVIDPQTIELYLTYAAATSAALTLSSGNVSSNQITTGAFADGARVTYRSAPGLGLKLTGVNVTVDGSGRPNGHDSNQHNLYVGVPPTVPNGNPGGHGLSEGQKITYRVADGSALVTGLTNGGTYYVHVQTAWTIQLAGSYCDAVGWDVDHSCIDNGDSDQHHARSVISVSSPVNCTTTPPPALPAACSVAQEIEPAAIGALVDGTTYVVRQVDSSHIALRSVGGSADLGLDMTRLFADALGSYQLFLAGVPLIAATGGQELYLQLTGSLAGQQKLLASDGTSLRAASPPPGDGQTSSSAKGGGGGALSVNVPSAQTTVSPSVKAYLAASNVTVDGDVTVTSTVKTNATAYASNGSGGLIAIADVSVAIDGTDTNSAFIGTGPDSLSGDPAAPQVDATGVTIEAGGNVKVGATTFLRTSATGSSESGGLGDFSNGSASVDLVDHTAAVIGKNAKISGSTVALVSTTGSKGYAAMSVTTYAFIGSATANANYTLTSTVTSILDGDAIDLRRDRRRQRRRRARLPRQQLLRPRPRRQRATASARRTPTPVAAATSSTDTASVTAA